MAHMEPQITHRQQWIEVETSDGITWIEHSLVGYVRDSEQQTHQLTDKERETIISKLSQYCDGTVQQWKTIFGYGARFSAPGYLDCTEWTVFETLQAAEEFIAAESEDDESDEEEAFQYMSDHGIEIELTMDQAESASHQGKCDDDVLALSKVPAIAAQLEKIDPEKLKAELNESGAWDAEELQDHQQNLQRILWIAAGQIKEENQ